MASPEARITLAVDVMGADKGPTEVLAGLLKATSFVPRNLKFLLFGPENDLSDLLAENSEWKSIDHEIRHAPEVVGMDEKPIAGIKNKKIHPWHSLFIPLKKRKQMRCYVVVIPVA